MGERRGAYVVLVVKLEGKTPLGRPRLRWEDNIMMDLREVGCGYMDWINLAHDNDICKGSNKPLGSIKCGEFLD
jgi:hypothetical protein